MIIFSDMMHIGLTKNFLNFAKKMRSLLNNIPLNKTHLYKSGHIEKDFQSEVFKYLRDKGMYIHRIPDL